ncbi:helix-turn-helix transcriptional regulator [Neolewinella persica]|uniref:helix-turn-helix transcriptional regulator n=1 Tax=Neolewinella persica TaxID=70998 RepID=UPI00036107D9|nr:helix-turn-helix transcriptional regulator [Neolewinella persica]
MQRYNRIKEVLDEKGIKYKWLAEKLDTSPQTVSRWCLNRMQPRVEMLYRIAGVLGVGVCALLVEEGEDHSG